MQARKSEYPQTQVTQELTEYRDAISIIRDNEQHFMAAAATAIPVSVVPVDSTFAVMVEPHADNLGRCRRCGRDFQRAAGIHSADARYYRCPECSDIRIGDFCGVQ